MFKRSQTATEYLIILAVVTVISVIVVGSLGDIVSLGSNSAEKHARLELQVKDVAIMDYVLGTNYSFFLVKNNLAQTIRLESFKVDSSSCLLDSFLLKVGEERKVVCLNVNNTLDDVVSLDYSTGWELVGSNSHFSLNESNKIIGTVIENDAFFINITTAVDYPGYQSYWREVNYEVRDDSGVLLANGSQDKGSISSSVGNIFPVKVIGDGYLKINVIQYADRICAAVRKPNPIGSNLTSSEGTTSDCHSGEREIIFNAVMHDVDVYIYDDYD